MTTRVLDVAGLGVTVVATGAAILRDISFTLDRGGTLGIVGESGCGKSTLLTALMGGVTRGLNVDGTVRIAGLEMLSASPETVRDICGRRVAMVPQNAAVAMTPSMTVGAQLEEQLVLKSDLPPRARRDRAIELAEVLRLPDPTAILSRYPHQLSGGQQQRVGIALALAGTPELLLLDEPTTALDVTTKWAILDLMQQIADRDRFAMIYVSHDIGVIARMCDRIGVIYAGELVEIGPKAETLTHPRHPYVEGLLASVPRISSAGLPRAMPGRPPGVSTGRTGCAFAPRCARADALCRAKPPDRVAAGQGLVACHRPLEQGMPVAARPRPAAGSCVAATGEILLRLEGVEVAWTLAGFVDRLSGRQPPATASDIGFTVAAGEVLGLIGESGSGKSTILRAIAGLWPARAGTVEFAGTRLPSRITARDAAQRRHIQMIFQNPEDSLNPRHTVGEIITRPLVWFRNLKGRDLDAELRRLVDAVRLPADALTRLPGALSGGEKQRVAIARALAAGPRLLLCDEVTSALDVSVQAAVLDLLAELRREIGVAMVFVSHDLAVVRHFADRLVILGHGRMLETGPTAEVLSRPSHPYTAGLVRSAASSDALWPVAAA